MNNQVTSSFEVPGPLRIVVATDLQTRSEKSLRRAIDLASSAGAKLSLVHAVSKTSSRPKARARRNIAYARILSAIEDATIGPRSELIDIDVRVGKPLDVIAAAARDANADLIVIAAPQARRLDSIVGTTAERLIRATQLPVLIVHRDNGETYRRAAVATDLSVHSISMLHAAARFGIFDRAHTTLLHAFDPPYVGMLKSVGVEEAGIKQYYNDWREELEVRARTILVAAGVDVDRSRVTVQSTQPAQAIGRLLEQEQPELLVIGASRWFLTKRLLVGSVADEVLRTALCDVLVIPRRFEKAHLARMRHAFAKPAASSAGESSRYF